MRTLRSWLIASHLIPIFVIIPVIGFTIFSLLNSQIVIDGVSQDLTDQAALIAEGSPLQFFKIIHEVAVGTTKFIVSGNQPIIVFF